MTSVMPAGGVHVLEEAISRAATIIVFATVVVRLGPAIVVVVVVVREPPLTLIGLALSTPEKAMMPPALPVLAEKVNV